MEICQLDDDEMNRGSRDPSEVGNDRLRQSRQWVRGYGERKMEMEGVERPRS